MKNFSQSLADLKLHYRGECANDAIYAYRKIAKISPSMYKPLQIQAPQTGNAKNPPLNRPSKYKPPGGFYLENCPQIQRKTTQKR